MKTLVTKRLILRQLKLTDIEDFYAYAKKPDIGPMAGWPPHKNLEQTYKILKMMIREEDTWAITLKEDDVLIGTIELHASSIFQALENKKELGYAIDDIYWGQGIVREAAEAILNYGFMEIELSEILCGHYPHNKQSQRVIEKLGFIYTHTEQKKDYKNNPIDVLMYKIIRKDYLEKRFQDDNTRQKV